ncbi:wall-associated receptor kinase 2-like [Bidens hawaiensis]|uniref:wall-associated receptor kinase 2-like n=1 Tax=Bidens hawaiensis TaxID=980011 RepID=UPI00404A5D7C
MKIHVLMWIIMLFFTASETYTLINSTNISKLGCESRCGDLIVPYPFGINSTCSMGHGFDIYCNTSSNPPMAYIKNTNTGYTLIKNISDSRLRVSSMVAATRCYSSDGTGSNLFNITPNFTNLPYTFSPENKFTMVGCNDHSWISMSGNKSTGCVVFCTNLEDTQVGECSGNGCCQTSIAHDISYYRTQLRTLLDEDDAGYRKPVNGECTYAFLAEENVFEFNGAIDLYNSSLRERIEGNVSVVLEWAIGNLSCEAAEAADGFACQLNSKCVNSTRVTGGYRCMCKDGHEGNPYLSPGCQDINECEDPRNNPCHGVCKNTPGSYNCTCPPGYFGDPKIKNGCQHNKDSKFSSKAFITAMVFGPLAIFSGIFGIFFGLRRRKLMKLREKFFEQNGGVLLKQKINSQGSHEAMTLFSTAQLRKATNNYSQEKIIGRGAYGVVYKGVLFDKRVVAIKKSKIVDASQAQQFINELLILTQVIHRNVVKILGCCLEEEVPILVYEYVSNNTLFHHIHSRLGGMSWLSWENRLRVAIETSGALAYLHSETIMPIIHRDVKSTNILLDDNYIAKVSDFGASRLIPLDHEQVTTLIQGTLGYLDPEYFSTSQLTDKSDVYSFGVVLAELITGKKPIGVDRTNVEKNLATYFVNSLKENRLYEIVEPRILREGTFEQLQLVGDLIKRCLNPEGCDRPTMKEVAVELDNLRKFTSHPWSPQQTSQDHRSLVLEDEQSDLYEVPLVSYGTTTDSESYYGNTKMTFEENKPR